MAIITEVRFAHEDGALVDTLTENPDLDVAVLRDARTDPEQNVYLIRFDNVRLDEIQTILESDHTVRESKPMPGFEDQRLLGIEFEPETKLLNPEVTNKDGFVLEARSSNTAGRPRGWHERWLLSDGEVLQDIWHWARQEGFEFEILELHQQGRSDLNNSISVTLTEQQREALVTAYERGYFTEPRETSLEELAESLEISPTAVGGRLKRGMKSLVSRTLIRDEEGK